MLHTLEAVPQPEGAARFLGPVHLERAQRVLVIFTQPSDEAREGAHASEPALAADWLRDEEDEAWTHLQPGAGAGGPMP